MAITDKLTAIANAIRSKTGESGTMTLAQMPSKIAGIQTDVSIGIENPETKAFRQEVKYPATYTSSQIANYKNSTSGYRNDEPTLITAADAKNNQQIYGNQVRWIYVPSVNNVRDIGGWDCNGGRIKYGLLYRGGEMNDKVDGTIVQKITAEDIARMRSLGIKVDLDFRRVADEGAGSPSPLGNDITYINCPCLDYSYIIQSLYPSQHAAYRPIINALITNILADNPIYFHCASGADRTGTVALLIEGLLGVSQSDADKDYELTTFSGENISRPRTFPAWTALLTTILSEQSTVEKWMINWWLNFDTTGSGNYVTASQLNSIRAKLVDGTPATITAYSIGYTLSHCSCGNYAPHYRANGSKLVLTFTADSGYTMNNISVTMGGVAQTVVNNTVTINNVTGNIVVEATAIIPAVNYSITNTLSNCTSNNSATTILEGNSYSATITPNSGYTLIGATVSVTMGGVNITSSAYSNGSISIASVTGNLVISISAAQMSRNLVPHAVDGTGAILDGVGYRNGVYWSSNLVQATFSTDSVCTAIGLIPFNKATQTTIYVKGIHFDGTSHCRMIVCNSNRVVVGSQGNLADSSTTVGLVTINKLGSNYYALTLGFSTEYAYFGLSAKTVSGAELIVQIDEPIE